ncbi:hypothetical protein L1987_57609 [Smallanthus sonchifolius]|uniref:Uncharacterized protein n=1 Tax=Smallanthus sonchifolius TaxID=185202 RepID=A0ACB9DDG9_9ASTR|nr:hypothetical protein L1987_57609 [Smallanthus sonchifolius]
MRGGGGGERWSEEFVIKKDTWKDHLSSVVVWVGQEIPYDRVVKLRIEGLPYVLHEENSYREIAGAYGKVIEPLDFHGRHSMFQLAHVWEVEHPWPPELKETLAPVMVGGIGDEEPGGMDLEEGEIRPLVEPEKEAVEIQTKGLPEN